MTKTEAEALFDTFLADSTHESRNAAVAAYADLDQAELDAAYDETRKSYVAAIKARDEAKRAGDTATRRSANETAKRLYELETLIAAAYNLRTIRMRQA